jgi:integrase
MATIHSRKRSGRKVWLAQVRLAGLRPIYKQFGSKGEAQAWADEEERGLKRLRDRGVVVPEAGNLTVADLVERYLQDPNTRALDSYEDTSRCLAYWRRDYGSSRLRAFGPVQVLDGRDRLLAKGLKPATVNRYLSWMRRAWNWGRTTGLVDSASAWPPELLLTENNKRSRFLSDDELDVLLKEAGRLYPVMRAAIVVSLACGIRQGELLRLEWRDVDLAQHSLTIRETKTDTPRAVFLPDVAATALKGLKKGAVIGRAVFLDEAGQPLTFADLVYRWNKIRSAAILKDFRWHDLRHSCASFLAQHGASLLEIGQVLGHKSPATTARYAHLVAGKAVTGHDKLDAKIKGAST